jgi:hypothetical protein
LRGRGRDPEKSESAWREIITGVIILEAGEGTRPARRTMAQQLSLSSSGWTRMKAQRWKERDKRGSITSLGGGQARVFEYATSMLHKSRVEGEGESEDNCGRASSRRL